jgi:RNA polymerase sigma-70 factor (ECF subfamily)
MNDALPRSAPASAIRESFDEIVLPHLAAGHALARCLLRNEHDADDVVQEASLRAFRYFRTFAGGDGRAWFLRIVRNACRDWSGRLAQSPTDAFDEELHSGAQSAFDPEALVLRTDDGRLLEQAMGALPDRFRELLVRRELDGLSYRELADVMDVPIGTVMSGLSRARQALRAALNNELKRSGLPARATPREQEADAVLA